MRLKYQWRREGGLGPHRAKNAKFFARAFGARYSPYGK